MKQKILLFLMIITSFLNAQEPYYSLVITEARMDGSNEGYLEITNLGEKEIQLSEFKVGHLDPWGSSQPIYNVWEDPWVTGDKYFFLPEKILKPGDSYVIAPAFDYGPLQYKRKVPGSEAWERRNQIDLYDVADLLLHRKEADYETSEDSVTTHLIGNPATAWNIYIGRDCWYLEHHYTIEDSVVVDQVGGVFHNEGKNQDGPADVAGVKDATRDALLIRKSSIKEGNLDFANARGLGLEDSEWIPIVRPPGYNAWRDLWWTVGNHGDFVLDENTLESDIIGIDFANKKLTVPWGICRLDDIMRHMKKKPGIAWNYQLNPEYQDSLYRSARTGDKLTVYVVGSQLQQATFDIVVSEPTNDVNIVIPIARPSYTGPITDATQNGILSWPRVTRNDSGEDTITGTWHGFPHALRADTLMKYLEKPTNASWRIEWVDEVARPDLKNGDKLIVKANNGNEKVYFIQVRDYEPSRDATITAITWPDVPAYLKGIHGWIGDTIPGFNSNTFNYRLQVPFDTEGIPALVAHVPTNSKMEVKRAKSLIGSIQDRTISFYITAEDDSVKNVYNVELIKEKAPNKIQPYYADPILSEFIFEEQYSNTYSEVYNPGNQPVDLSNYMVAYSTWTNEAAEVIRTVHPWNDRYMKYIPGTKWVDEVKWQSTPAVVVPDLGVNAILQGGDAFAMGAIRTDKYVARESNWVWPVPDLLDVQFFNTDGLVAKYKNPWGETVSDQGVPMLRRPSSNFFLWRILNDSVPNGLKPANDPNDFELIDRWGMETTITSVICGVPMVSESSYRRKPEFFKGNPIAEASFGSDHSDCEWDLITRATLSADGVQRSRFAIAFDLGQHYLYDPTHYLSTITSQLYKVSNGYSTEEEIRGVITGTTVNDFLNKILKADEQQSLTIISSTNGIGLDGDALITHNDTLIVLSADSTNTSKYILEVSDQGLSSDAVITSTLYEVTVESQINGAGETTEVGVGYISGFEYGTLLSTFIKNINLPFGATMDIIDSKGAYVSQKRLNFDTSYVNVTVNSDIYLDVLAENGVTQIIYQLLPTSSEDDAFALSDVYSISQADNLIKFIPRYSNVQTFLSYIIPSTGASIKLIDKMGHERVEGSIVEDDKLLVTSANGINTRIYHLSLLGTQYIAADTHLAYLLSNIYSVDQINLKITGPTVETKVSEFASGIRSVMGANFIIIDADGNSKTTGDLSIGDQVKVTSANGKIVVLYDIDITTFAKKVTDKSIEVYPNPTSGKVTVQGLEPNTRIQVFNYTGKLIVDTKSYSNIETISLENQPSGLYLIVFSKNKNFTARYKVLRK